MLKGLTLIEILLYIAILSFFLLMVIGFIWNFIFGNIKERAFQEVQENGRFAMTKISQEIKKAIGINNPQPGFSSNSLSLAMADNHLDPTIFSVVNGKLTITQGQNPPLFLTSNLVRVTDLLFTNLSYENASGTVRIEMTIEHVNPEGRAEYEASISLNSTITLIGGSSGPYLCQLHYRWRNDDGGE
jgi:Tfp pilus assembly protein PilW